MNKDMPEGVSCPNSINPDYAYAPSIVAVSCVIAGQDGALPGAASWRR